MKPARIFRLIGFVAWVLLMGCAECPESTGRGGYPYAGGSAGCGNPPRLADLEPTDVNGCEGLECGSGNIGPTRFKIGLGSSLSIDFNFPSKAQDPTVRIYLFAADQIPVFQKLPLDSFDLETRNGIVLTPSDLENAVRNAPYKVEDVFVFTLYAVAVPISSQPDLVQEGLLALLALDINAGTFFTNETPTWGRDDIGELLPPSRYFQGKVATESAGVDLSEASAAYVFIPGSPFYTQLDMQNMQFRLNGLTQSGFELRMIAIPASMPADRKIPVYLLNSAPASGSERGFQIGKTKDTAVIPPDFP